MIINHNKSILLQILLYKLHVLITEAIKIMFYIKKKIVETPTDIINDKFNFNMEIKKIIIFNFYQYHKKQISL